MQRCLNLAKNGLGTTYPNPMVGAVLVCDDQIIGEGWHRKAGEPHAEVLAIASVVDKQQLQRSTLYVSLEPCSHFGKTPPCADLVVASKIPKVVVGNLDPNPKVAGKGIKKLLDAGCEVRVGVLEKDCRFINRRFFTYHQQQRPYIILKWAESADGLIAPATKNQQRPFWISSKISRQLVHKWRTEEQAVLVGAGTVLADNPQLTARYWEGKNPLRVVLKGATQLPAEAAVLDNRAATLVLSTGENIGPLPPAVEVEQLNKQQSVAQQTVEILYKRGVQSLIVEGGKQLLDTFISEDLWDEARVFRSSAQLKEGLPAPAFTHTPAENLVSDTDTLHLYYHAH